MTVFVLSAGRFPFSRAAVTSGSFRAYLKTAQRHCLGDFMVAPWLAEWKQPNSAEGTHTWKWPDNFSAALVHLLRGCLAVRPAERPTMSQVKEHPWFRDPHWQPECRALGPELLVSPPLPHAAAAEASHAAALPDEQLRLQLQMPRIVVPSLPVDSELHRGNSCPDLRHRTYSAAGSSRTFTRCTAVHPMGGGPTSLVESSIHAPSDASSSAIQGSLPTHGAALAVPSPSAVQQAQLELKPPPENGSATPP